ncbi:MAG: hypothetical protein ACLFPS_06570 [Clostridia bacterium]
MKRIITILAVLIMLLAITACSENAIEVYKIANQNTEELNSGKTKTTVIVNNQFEKSNLEPDQIEELENLKNIEFSATISFNNDENISETNLYYKYGNVGYDFLIYSLEERVYIKFPMQSKFVDFSTFTTNFDENEIEKSFNQEIFSLINDKWLEMLEKDNVVRGNKSVMETEDGDVKVTEYAIEPSQDQLFVFLYDVVQILNDNKDSLEYFIEFDQEQPLELYVEDIMNEIENVSFSYRAYIDIDNYLVNESIKLHFELNDVKTDVSIDIDYWDNNKDQNIQLPNFNEDNLIDFDNLDDEYKFEFGRVGE